MQLHDEHAVVAAVLLGIAGHHALGGNDPCLIGANIRDAKVPDGRAALGQENSFSRTKDYRTIGIHLGDEERGAMSKDVVIICTLASVNEIEPIRVCYPMLLRVVTAKVSPIIERPGPDCIKMQSVITGGQVRPLVVAKRQEEAIAKLRERWLRQSTIDL